MDYSILCLLEQNVLNSYVIDLLESERFVKDEVVKDLILEFNTQVNKLNDDNKRDIMYSSISSINSLKKEIHSSGSFSDHLLELYFAVRKQRIKNVVLEESYIDIEGYLLDKQFVDLNENFSNYNIITEGVGDKISEFLSNLKNKFGSKHEKIVARDGEWLKSNKDKLKKKNFKDTTIEVPSDFKVTFTQLLNRYDIFEKNFKKASTDEELKDNTARFRDKNGNLKNGIENYYRTGNARREVTLKKLSDNEIKENIILFIDYCEEFLSGKGFIDDKINNLIGESIENTERSEVKESVYSIIRSYGILLEAEVPKNIDDKTVYNDDNTVKKHDDIVPSKKEKNEKDETDDDNPVDDEIESDENDESTEEEKDDTKVVVDRIQDRKDALTVLMTISEARYFDYIDLLKGLSE